MLVPYCLNYCSFVINLLILLLETMIAVGVMAFGRMLYSLIKLFAIDSNPKTFWVSIVLMFANVMLYNRCFSGNDMHYAKFINVFGYYVCSFLGVASIIFFSIWLTRFRSITKLFSFLGTNSLVIMTTHLEYHVVSVVLFLCTSMIKQIVIVKIVSFLLICIIEVLICFIVDKTPLKGIYKIEKSVFIGNEKSNE